MFRPRWEIVWYPVETIEEMRGDNFDSFLLVELWTCNNFKPVLLVNNTTFAFLTKDPYMWVC
jgi:hypothetical protein